MICRRCGAQSDGKSAFCPECGAAMLQVDDKTVAAPDSTMRADFEATQAAYGEEKTVAARDYADEATVIAGDADIDRTVAAPNYKPEVQPNGAPQYGYPEPAPKQKKSPVVPILAGIIVVLVVALAGVLFFRDDVTGMFEKETTTVSESKTESKKEDKTPELNNVAEEESVTEESGYLQEETSKEIATGDVTTLPNVHTRPGPGGASEMPAPTALEILIEDVKTRPFQERTTEAVKPTVPDRDKTTYQNAETRPTAKPTPEPAPQPPRGKAEIVAYFNKAINNVKPSAKKIVHKSSSITLNGSTQIPGAVELAMNVLGGADKFIGDQLAKQSKGEQVYTGADIKAKFPVEGETYASKLTADDVASAGVSWSDDGKYLIVKLVAKSDAKSSSVKHGTGHAPKAFNVVLPGVVNDNVPGPVKSMLGGPAEMDYPECQVVAYVNFDTGRVEKAQYVTNWTITFGDDIVLPFRTTDLYEISY